MGKPLVRFCEGQEFNCGMDEISWHRRESRRKQRKQTSSYSHGRLLSTRKYWQKRKPEFQLELVLSVLHYSTTPADCRKRGKTIESPSGGSPKPGPLGPDSLLEQVKGTTEK